MRSTIVVYVVLFRQGLNEMRDGLSRGYSMENIVLKTSLKRYIDRDYREEGKRVFG